MSAAVAGRSAGLAVLAVQAVLLAGACAPRAAPLRGTPLPERSLPALELPAGPRLIVFRWDYEENSLRARGEGAIRATAPDTARVDLYLAGGLPAGHAVLLGETFTGPNVAQIRRVIPPPAMMWAALGRLAVPALPDTTLTQEGATLYADIGKPAAWRATIRDGRLMQLARLSGGRVAEVVTRGDGGRLLYEVPGRRRLWIGILRDEEAAPFDPAIWRN